MIFLTLGEKLGNGTYALKKGYEKMWNDSIYGNNDKAGKLWQAIMPQFLQR